MSSFISPPSSLTKPSNRRSTFWISILHMLSSVLFQTSLFLSVPRLTNTSSYSFADSLIAQLPHCSRLEMFFWVYIKWLSKQGGYHMSSLILFYTPDWTDHLVGSRAGRCFTWPEWDISLTYSHAAHSYKVLLHLFWVISSYRIAHLVTILAVAEILRLKFEPEVPIPQE